MPADAGAQQILNLLNQPSDLLLQNLVVLAKAQRKQVQKPFGVLPQYGVDALAQIRSFYRDLRAQIDAIETVDVGSRGQRARGARQPRPQLRGIRAQPRLRYQPTRRPKGKEGRQEG